MMRKCTKYIFLLLFALLIIPTSIYFTNTQESVQNYNQSLIITDSVKINTQVDNIPEYYAGYTITNYDMDIKIGEDNVFHIVETIHVDFSVRSHGIYRDIPYINEVQNPDGTTTKQVAKITNLKTNDTSSTSKKDGVLSIKIGDPNSYVNGSKIYLISYDYNLGKDKTREYDELYFNIIGSEWTTTIDKVSFSIEMPKTFDPTNLGFSKGYEGSVGYENLEYSVDGNIISGYTTEKLLRNQALTIRLQLPENYFSQAKNLWSKFIIAGFIVSSVCVLVVVLLVVIIKKKNRRVQTVEFYPPKDCNSLDVAFIYKAHVNNKDVVSLMIYLADKGYIKIEELGGLGEDIRVTKLREYNGNNAAESNFLNALFANKNSLLLSEINRDYFSKAVTEIENQTKQRLESEIFDKKGKIFKSIINILAIIALLAPAILIFINENFMILCVYMFPIVAISIMIPISAHLEPKMRIIVVPSVLFSLLPLVFFVFPLAMNYGIYFLLSNIWGVICSFIISIISISGNIVVRTELGAELYAKILGFRNFIKTAEKDRLEVLSQENPTYYYDILPFAYVLGVSDVWIKKFEFVAIPEVSWYYGISGRTLRIATFNSICTSMSKYSTSPSSSGGSSGGGGFSGGGSSGGGSGGGGGGRW